MPDGRIDLRSGGDWRHVMLVLMLVGLAGLAGCGQKGPLSLPEPPPDTNGREDS